MSKLLALAALTVVGVTSSSTVAGATDTTTPPTGSSTTAVVGASTVPSTPAADTDVITLTNFGGLVPNDAFVRFGPLLRITASGDIYTAMFNTMIDPQPLIYPVAHHKLTAKGLAEVIGMLRAEKMLDPAPNYNDPMPNVMDAGSTELTINVDGHKVVHQAYALGLGNADGPETNPARKHLQDVLAKLVDVESLTAAGELTNPPFVPSGYQMVATEINLADYTGDPNFKAEIVDWPASAGVTLATTTRCVPLDVKVGNDVLLKATMNTFFKENGKLYRVGARALSPGEQACATLPAR